MRLEEAVALEQMAQKPLRRLAGRGGWARARVALLRLQASGFEQSAATAFQQLPAFLLPVHQPEV
jgi:hypothetical protein